jgi:hypothetical protein
MAGEARHIRVARGILSQGVRGEITLLERLPLYVAEARKNNEPLFRSYYRFDEDIQTYFEKHHSVAGYPGKAYIDRLRFDLDFSGEGDDVLGRTKAFVERLGSDYNVPETHIRVFFSGRGYHVEIPDIFGFEASETLHIVVKNTFAELFPEADDIYDKLRLYRVANTVNEKTNLYKIPLTVRELFSLSRDEIFKLAETPRPDFRFDDADDLGTPVAKLIKDEQKATVKPIQESGVGKVSFEYEPIQVFTCIQKAFDEGAIPGSRNKKILRIATVWQRQGIPMEATITALQNWAPDLGAKAIQVQVERCYKAQYPFGCHDEIMHKYCDPRCIFYARKDSVHAKVDAKQMERDFVKYVQSDYTKDSINLAHIFKLDDDFWIFPGEFDVVWGDTGVGKSAFVQYLLSRIRLKTLVLSLENHQHLFFRRQIQIAHNMSKTEVIAHYKMHNNTLSNDIQHIKVITTSPALNNLRRIITDENPKLVIVDTLDGVIVEGARDETASGIKIANTLKQLAQTMNIIILGVHHISKHAAQDEDGRMRVLTIHSGKGSSSIEQKADKVIGIEGDRAGEFRRIRVLKARDETPFLIQAMQDKSTFVFHQVLPKEGKSWPVQPENTQQTI